MSVRIMAAVFDSELPTFEKLVALALADHCHDDGTEARPGLERLEAKTSMSRDGVRKVLRRLVERGVLEVQRPATSHRPAAYRFVLGALRPSVDRVDRSEESAPTPSVDPVDRIGSTPAPLGSTGSTRTVRTVQNPLIVDETVDGAPRRRPGPTPIPPRAGLALEADRVYRAYPRKTHRADALAAITRTLKAGAAPRDLVDAAAQLALEKAGDEPRFVPHAARFYGPSAIWREYLERARAARVETFNAAEAQRALEAEAARRHAEGRPMPESFKKARDAARLGAGGDHA